MERFSSPLVLHVSRHLFVEVAWLARLVGQSAHGLTGIDLSSGTTLALGGWI